MNGVVVFLISPVGTGGHSYMERIEGVQNLGVFFVIDCSSLASGLLVIISSRYRGRP